jgi:multidrug efflux pump
VLVVQEQTISVGQAGRGQLPVQFVVQNLNFDKLKEKVPLFIDEVVKSPVFQGNDVNLKFNKPELQITIDRLKASELGISIMDISNTLQLALSDLDTLSETESSMKLSDKSIEKTGMLHWISSLSM